MGLQKTAYTWTGLIIYFHHKHSNSKRFHSYSTKNVTILFELATKNFAFEAMELSEQ